MEDNLLKYKDYLTEEEKTLIKNDNISVYFPGLKKELKFYNYIINDYYKGKIGDHLNFRYEILTNNIGKGAYGSVIKSFDWKHKKIIAIKIIKKRFSNRHHLAKEIEILGIIKSKKDDNNFLIDYLGKFNHKSHICFKFSLYNENLYIYGKRFGKIPIEQCIIIVKEIICGLKFLHDNNIIHGDLKPENILFKDSSYSNVVIIDFGLSFIEGDKISINNNFYLQSRYYRAPEIILEIKKTKAMDIWSMGCILYEINKFEVLFQGNNNTKMVENFLSIMGIPNDEITKIIIKKFKINSNNIKFNNFNKLFNSDWFESRKKEAIGYYEIIRKCIVWDHEKRIKIDELDNISSLEDDNIF